MKTILDGPLQGYAYEMGNGDRHNGKSPDVDPLEVTMQVYKGASQAELNEHFKILKNLQGKNMVIPVIHGMDVERCMIVRSASTVTLSDLIRKGVSDFWTAEGTKWGFSISFKKLLIRIIRGMIFLENQKTGCDISSATIAIGRTRKIEDVTRDAYDTLKPIFVGLFGAPAPRGTPCVELFNIIAEVKARHPGRMYTPAVNDLINYLRWNKIENKVCVHPAFLYPYEKVDHIVHIRNLEKGRYSVKQRIQAVENDFKELVCGGVRMTWHVRASKSFFFHVMEYQEYSKGVKGLIDLVRNAFEHLRDNLQFYTINDIHNWARDEAQTDGLESIFIKKLATKKPVTADDVALVIDSVFPEFFNYIFLMSSGKLWFLGSEALMAVQFAD